MLTKNSDTSYELKVGDKKYRIAFTLGMKDELYRIISGVYATANAVNQVGVVVPDEMKLPYLSAMQRQKEAAEPDEIEQLAKEAADAYGAILRYIQDETLRQSGLVRDAVLDSIRQFKYDVWAFLLTKRNLEGEPVDEVTPNQLKTEELWSSEEAESSLEELLGVVLSMVDERLKKTLATAKRLKEIVTRENP